MHPPTARLPALADDTPGRLVAAMLAFAALLALAMALSAGINRDPSQWRGPPDEPGHRAAARYYVDHWLPPKVGDSATLDSYSRDYGLSYVNDLDPAYPLAGKFAALLAPVVPDVDLGFRLFNVSLLALLAAFAWRRPGAWPVFLPLLLSPQVWYVFSYFNGDALPLFLAVVLTYQIACPGSLLGRYLDAPGIARGLHLALLAALLAGLLLLCKRNYATYLAFAPALLAAARLGPGLAIVLIASAVGAAAIVLNWVAMDLPQAAAAAGIAALAGLAATFAPRGTRAERARIAGKILVLAAFASALAFGRQAWDFAVNGPHDAKYAATAKLQEQLAKPGYKPSQIYAPASTPAAPAFHGIGMRARGVPLSGLFESPWLWHIRTFQSATGTYNWLDIYGPTTYYAAIALGYLVLFGAYVRAVAGSRSAEAWGTLAAATALTGLTVGISLFHSWANDFQAQGRYLFPVVAMLGAGLMVVRQQLATRLFATAVSACFLLSAWSFIWVGLRQVPKAF